MSGAECGGGLRGGEGVFEKLQLDYDLFIDSLFKSCIQLLVR